MNYVERDERGWFKPWLPPPFGHLGRPVGQTQDNRHRSWCCLRSWLVAARNYLKSMLDNSFLLNSSQTIWLPLSSGSLWWAGKKKYDAEKRQKSLMAKVIDTPTPKVKEGKANKTCAQCRVEASDQKQLFRYDDPYGHGHWPTEEPFFSSFFESRACEGNCVFLNLSALNLQVWQMS